MNNEAGNWHVSETPLGRVGHLDDVANAAVFLASEDSHRVIGEGIAVSGEQR